jgi:hypothetical protein
MAGVVRGAAGDEKLLLQLAALPLERVLLPSQALCCGRRALGLAQQVALPPPQPPLVALARHDLGRLHGRVDCGVRALHGAGEVRSKGLVFSLELLRMSAQRRSLASKALAFKLRPHKSPQRVHVHRTRSVIRGRGRAPHGRLMLCRGRLVLPKPHKMIMAST